MNRFDAIRRPEAIEVSISPEIRDNPHIATMGTPSNFAMQDGGDPLFLYYAHELCPICARTDRIFQDLRCNMTFDCFYVNIKQQRGHYYQWYRNFCTEELDGHKLVPLFVWWEDGFDSGSYELYMLEKRYSGTVTETIERKVAQLSKNLREKFKPFQRRRVRA